MTIEDVINFCEKRKEKLHKEQVEILSVVPSDEFHNAYRINELNVVLEFMVKSLGVDRGYIDNNPDGR